MCILFLSVSVCCAFLKAESLQGVQQGAQNSDLGSSNVKGHGWWGISAQSHHVGSDD